MNLLIVVGLLAFALVAILAAVLLALSEQKASKAVIGQAAAKPTSEQPTKTAVLVKEEQAASTNKQNLPVLSKTALPVSIDVLNGPFHQFAAEIHALHEEAVQLEQRLSVLVEMVDSVERTQGGHVSIEEELTLPVNSTPA